MSALDLIVRRTIAASAERLFEAWTTPSQLMAWWGPRGVRCTHAEIDLRVGGDYRIDNLLPEGSTLTIRGRFISIEPPQRLVYSWSVGDAPSDERVTVRFESRGDNSTEVLIIHERILDAAVRAGHARGWEGCLDGLAAHAGP